MHKIAVIGGDGIGPEVVAEALKVVAATGVALDTGRLRPRRRPLRAHRRGAARRDLDELARSSTPILLGAVGPPIGSTGCRPASSSGVCSWAALRARPVRQPAPVRRVPGPIADGRRFRRRAREHRRHLRRRRRLSAARHAARGRDPGLGEHPLRRRALRAVRLRARRAPRPAPPHARAQDQRAHLRGRPVAADASTRSPPSYADVADRYHHVDAACIYLRPGPRPLRRHRHRQPLRRHPHRPRRRRRRRDRPGRVGQPQPRPHRPVAVRAGARLGPRHRRHRQGRIPCAAIRLGGDDARIPRRADAAERVTQRRAGVAD